MTTTLGTCENWGSIFGGRRPVSRRELRLPVFPGTTIQRKPDCCNSYPETNTTEEASFRVLYTPMVEEVIPNGENS